MKKRILISGLGGALFPYLHEKLQNQYELFYIDCNVNLKKIYLNYNLIISPPVKDINYISCIESVIKKHNIDFYIPLIDEEIVLAINIAKIFNNIVVIAPNLNFTELCLNKLDLMKSLKSLGISNIYSLSGIDYNRQIDFPLFVKPNTGRGSRGARKIISFEQLEAYYILEGYGKQETLIQPFVDGVEYTVGVLINSYNNIISISSKRIIEKKGITQIAITENNILIDKVVEQIVEKMKPCGPINIQLILTNNGVIKIFEINPRFSTTTILEYEGGIDLITKYIQFYNSEYYEQPLRPNINLTLHRRWENIFYYD